MKGMTIRKKSKTRRNKHTRKSRHLRRLKQKGGELKNLYPDAVVVKQREDPNEIIDGLPVLTSVKIE